MIDSISAPFEKSLPPPPPPPPRVVRFLYATTPDVAHGSFDHYALFLAITGADPENLKMGTRAGHLAAHSILLKISQKKGAFMCVCGGGGAVP